MEWPDLAPQIERVIGELKLETGEKQKEQLRRYVMLLLQGLQTQRIVGDRKAPELIRKHLFDSLYPLTLLDPGPGKLLDLGTGAGLPGIPLKIMLPRNPVYFLDSNRRKINFIRRAAAELELAEVYFLPGRAESWARDDQFRETFACVTCRAVAAAAILAELALPFLRKGGGLIIYKGPKGPLEIEQAAKAISFCGGRLKNSWIYRLPAGEERTLFLIEKIAPTPSLYPRPPGRLSQKPLR